MRSRLRVLSALLVCIGVVATSASAGTEQRRSAPPPVGRVSREMPPGAKSVIVFVSVGGKEYAATAGTRHPKADQRFRIGSVTKTFTATIVLQLVQEGTLRLDSTLEEHLPGVVPRGGEITIRHLLGHRSGLANITDYPGWLNQAERSPSTSPINTLRFAASKPLAFRPGSQERYSNTNYIALGLVIEKVTGRSYAEELEQRVLDPLGLSRTELPTTRRLADLDDAGYNPNLPWAAGAIVSNAHDLSRFYSALLSGRILSAASLGAMKDTAKTYGVFGTGLGIFSTDLACGRSWGHAGGILDYGTLVTASEEGDRVAVVSLRGPGYLPWLSRALLCAEPPPRAGSPRAGEDRVHEQHRPGSQPAVRRERRRERAAVANAQRVDLRSRLVAGRADDRLREPARRQRRDLRRERRRERAAEADAQPGARLRSRLVARGAEDRLRPRPRPRPGQHAYAGGLRHERRREPAVEAGATRPAASLVAGRAEARLHARARRGQCVRRERRRERRAERDARPGARLRLVAGRAADRLR